MNKIRIIALLFALVTFHGCDRIISTKHTTNETMVNKTLDKYIYILDTDVKIDTIFSNGLDSNGVVFIKNSTIDLPIFGAYTIEISRVLVNRRYLYNISDTTSYIQPNINNYNDSILFTHVKFNGVMTGSIYNQIDTSKLIVNNEIKKIFSKDYTMLDKFKDYYKK
ncbi:MAG: hypothetical protein WCK78_07385 [Paludibacter sp.]